MPHQSVLSWWILTQSLTSGMGAVGAGSARGTGATVIASASATVATSVKEIVIASASATVGALTGTGAAVTITVGSENRLEEIGGTDTMSATRHDGSTSAVK